MSGTRLVIGGGDGELDRRLTSELDAFNTAATPGAPAQRELTVRAVDEEGDLVGGISGWTWDEAAGIALTWVEASVRGTGVGVALVAAFETAARERGARRCFVTSFTFQAPGFYERQGYVEIFRWEGVPREGSDDVHLRKDL